MAKQELYMATRSGGRLGRQTRELLLERFISSGSLHGAPEEVVEVANLCLERGWGFSLDQSVTDGLFQIIRA